MCGFAGRVDLAAVSKEMLVRSDESDTLRKLIGTVVASKARLETEIRQLVVWKSLSGVWKDKMERRSGEQEAPMAQAVRTVVVADTLVVVQRQAPPLLTGDQRQGHR